MNCTFKFGTKTKPKYISLIWGKDLDKEDYKLICFYKHTFGWDFNIGRFIISYDNF